MLVCVVYLWLLCVIHQLPEVEAPLANLDAVLETDLSSIVQKVRWVYLYHC